MSREDEQADPIRAARAMKEICDGREPVPNMPAIMVTLEYTVAGILLEVMDRNPDLAAELLNEGFLQGVESASTCSNSA